MMKRHAILLLCFAATLLVSGRASAQAVDVTGKWDVAFNTGQEVIPAVLTINKQGDKLAGTIRDGRAPEKGEAPVEVAVAEKKVTISFDYGDADGAMHIVMTGTAGSDTMSGTVEYGTRGQGDWSAKRSTGSGATAAATPAAGATNAKVDVSGTWALSVTTSEFSSSPTAVLKQDGEKLTGQYVSTQYGSFPIEGTVKGNQVSWAVAMAIEGNSLSAKFSGTVENGTINGTVNYGGFAEGTFTGKKK
jgi:hypothetical protein